VEETFLSDDDKTNPSVGQAGLSDKISWIWYLAVDDDAKQSAMHPLATLIVYLSNLNHQGG